ncbi:nucleotide sugar dehydrogenase [Salinisphaera sp. USBA-960]|uniref:nucleotide sugar dehydrogenase n=1 Tax=Salinisphaera orenii TaxID=856731 RepID=UPI000DBE8CBB|nr:nucleotide sugar dehydrogenase [Salifodinibacter halophilus]NNC25949.1 nucleotide sugar dehydrogenase [Salifodinibacter halophilus]
MANSQTVAIVGLGYVGLPLVLQCIDSGLGVIGLDTDPTKVQALNSGRSYLQHLDSERIARLPERAFEATGDYARLTTVDAVILCVPTPLDEQQTPDLSFLTSSMEAIAPRLRAGQLVALESTSYPGTTEEAVAPIIERHELVVGRDIALVFCPERADPGNEQCTTRAIPKVLGGITPFCRERGIAFYEQMIDRVVPVSSARAAEMTKLLENIHRAVNIGLVNEMKVVADAMAIDIHEVITAAATKPFGFTPYRPGPGLGGHCIPIDPFYLTWKARAYGVDTRLTEVAGQINHAMPLYVVDKIAAALNDRYKAVRGSRILILGLAYKKNIDDMRETPAAKIMSELSKRGAELAYSDPHIPTFAPMRAYQFDLSSIDATPEHLAAQDCVVIVTDHDAFDYAAIAANADLVVDTRARLSEHAPNVVRA